MHKYTTNISGITVLALSLFVVYAPALAMNIEKLTVVAAGDVQPGTAASQDMPMGQGEDGEISLLPEDAENLDDSDLFGTKGGYFHPYFTLAGEYTDNLYNVNYNTKSNFLTRFSPGIWVSLPRTREIPVEINPHNSSPGGLRLQLKEYEGTDRYQAYALAGMDYNMYSEDSDLNDYDARLEGVFRYNLRGGLSLQALDRYTYGLDRFEAGAQSRNNERRFYSNILKGTADYQITDKLRAKGEYSNFLLNYDEAINDFLDRTDNIFDIYGYFTYSLKTSLFLQYRYTDVGYDSAELKDNKQHYWYGGINWKTSEKVSLLLKAGYQSREYTAAEIADLYDWSGLTFELQSRYLWTEKTQFTLDMYRRSEESDSSVAIDQIVIGAALGYQQQYTDKLSGLITFMYEDVDYTQVNNSDRNDKRYYFRPAVQYLFRDWLMTELAYQYDKRVSTQDLFDYDSNTVLLNINLAM